MVSLFTDYIIKEKLFDSNNKILLAVSGGLDSAVMTELFHQAQFDFAIAHCNFNLRGTESDLDEKFVRQLANNLNVPFYSIKFDTKKYAESNSISIQMAARDLRQNWLGELVKNHNYNFYATAHHLDDQIETLIINLLRGTGLSGIHGILPKKGIVIHPMLFCYRNQISEFAKKHNLKHREDSSNLKTDYTRNKIRHKLIPIIEEINSDYQKVITDNIYRFRETEKIYKQQIDKVSSSIIKHENTLVKISIKEISDLNPIETYLFEMVKEFGFNYDTVRQIVNSLNSTSGKVFYSTNYKLVKDREHLLIEKLSDLDKTKYIIGKDLSQLQLPIKFSFSRFTKPDKYEITVSKNMAIFDYSALEFPLILRKWETGDFFYPLGLNKKKLLSDYFIDNKFSLIDKNNAWILTSGNKIIWIVGHRIDDRFKITDSTKNILQIELSR